MSFDKNTKFYKKKMTENISLGKKCKNLNGGNP